MVNYYSILTVFSLAFIFVSTPLQTAAALDSDGDGLLDSEETFIGTDPHDADTDDVGDLFEATYAGECVDITIDNSDHDEILDPDDDCDGDTLTNDQEETASTSPLATDTDSDGYSDAIEIAAGSDPIDIVSTPEAIAIAKVSGKQQGIVQIIFSDDTTLEINAFGGAAKPTVRLATDDDRIVAVKGNGRTLKVYAADGTLLAKKSLHHQAQSKVKLKVWNFYADAKDEIVIVTKQKKTLQTILVRLTTASKLKRKNKQTYTAFTGLNFQVKKKQQVIKIKQGGQILVKYKVKSNGQLKTIY